MEKSSDALESIGSVIKSSLNLAEEVTSGRKRNHQLKSRGIRSYD